MADKYIFKEKIYESSLTIIQKAVRTTDNKNVILKILNKELPVENEIQKFASEYDILKKCSGENVIEAYGFEKYLNTVLIELEDFGGKPISFFIKEKLIDINKALFIISEAVNGLETIHNAGVIHKDINTNNILYNSETQQVKIIDLNIASVHDASDSEKLTTILEGTLTYISPEQTGRINVPVDFRTDFFSLGTAFYELLTGNLPFISSDQMELIHSLLAQMPVAPHIVKNDIPEIVSKIVMKLLAKNPQDRYQSCFGLKADLEKCIDCGLKYGYEELKKFDFPLAEKDIIIKFEISKKLFGRQKEIDSIINSLNRVVEGAFEITFISGSTGTGKTALVNEIQKNVSDKSRNLSGKFDDFHNNVPYFGIIQIVNQFVKQVLSSDVQSITQWSKKILKAVGQNGKILTDFAPNIEYIIGKQPDLVELGGFEAQNRFYFVIISFFKCIGGSKKPLVLFLDDLQCADASSMDLLKHILASNKLENTLFLGSYRSNEIDKNQSLKLSIDEISKSGAIFQNIVLDNLDNKNVQLIVSETLKSNTPKEKDLANIVYNKTSGNPFFINQFFKNLFDEKLLHFSYSKNQWLYDLEKIEKLKITENVLDFLSAKINKLPADSIELIKIASAIGISFDYGILSEISDLSDEEIIKNLNIWENENLILIDDISTENKKYSFIHDKIWQVAYSGLEDEIKKQYHYKIGKFLIGRIKEEDLQNSIFEVVYHWNNAISIVKDEKERQKISELNYTAGLKAKSSSARSSSFNYFKHAIESLGSKSWIENYDFTLSLFNLASESSYLCGEYEFTEFCIESIEKNAKNFEDKLFCYEIKVQSLKGHGRLAEAVKTGIEVAKYVGIKIPENPTKIEIIFQYLLFKFTLSTRKIEDIISLPEIKDKRILSVIKIMSSAGVAAYFYKPAAFPINLFKRLKLGLKYGNADVTAVGFAGYGLFLCGLFEDFNNGYKYGKLAFTLMEKLNSQTYRVETQFRFNCFIRVWKEHIKESIKPLLDSYLMVFETGEIEFASHSLANHFMFKYFLGYELNKLKNEMLDYYNEMKQLKQSSSYSWFLITYKSVLALLNTTEEKNFYSGEYFDEQSMIPKLVENEDKTSLGCFYIMKTGLNYLVGKYDEALSDIENVSKYISSMTSTYYLSINALYTGLTLVTFCESSKSQRPEFFKKINNCIKKLKKYSKTAPENNLHKYYLLEAEKFRILKKNTNAREFYDLAIIAAKENGFLGELALANELAAKFQLSLKQSHTASHYFDDAFFYYSKWGAKLKIEELRKNYPQFFANKSSTITSTTYGTTYATTITDGTRIGTSQSLDLISVVKASQAISGEVSLSRLLEKMLRIILENAGAEKGVIIENNSGKLMVQAQGVFNGNISVMINQNLNECKNICQSIVNYVSRTKEIFILEDASTDINYSSDSYIKSNNIKSVLCFPILNKNYLSAIIYLENNIMQGAFTTNRVEILKMLSSQITTSIENAQLYENLEEKVKERTLEVEKQKEVLVNQSQKLEEYNHELEKLSIVASETDNAILIMDSTGNFEWVNEGFTRLYGYNLVALINEVGFNIVSISSHQNIQKILDDCITFKKSITYESVSKTSKGIEIWVQTTLTPIMDEYGNVNRLVAIDSNISKLKEFENQILDKNNLLNSQNENIRASIRYALTIQNAILPDKTVMDSYFENFVIYKPKDIVSGDFYWFAEAKRTENKLSTVFIAVADCTGHGVPGAFMSLIGNRLLNEIIIEKQTDDLAVALEMLNSGIRTSLHQNTTDNIDGMDISICKIEKTAENKNNITFSGAKSTLFYYSFTEKKILKLKGDRRPIGGISNPRNKSNFTNQNITLCKNDVLYLFSDGIIDQNNLKRTRFGSERFTDVLHQIAENEIHIQKIEIENALNKWQENEDQRDDITILGIKF